MHQAHPDWHYSLLVRSKDKAAQVTSKYPNVRIVLGDLDSSDIIEEEVKNADIVLREYLSIQFPALHALCATLRN